MASFLKNLSNYDETTLPDTSEMKMGVVVAEWNAHITHNLYEACMQTLTKHGIMETNIHTIQVPGSFELTSGAQILGVKYPDLDSIICLGCVIKGDTKHDDYINNAVALGLTTLGLGLKKSIIFGLVTVNDEQQAQDRSGGKHGNKGTEAAITAIRMAGIKRHLNRDKGKIGF
jgi:6,7-dimethyl-8-ribityllumazine synthase